MIYVENSPPDPDIRIDEGIFVGQNNWKVPTDRYIRIDAGESTDNDNNLLYYEWEYDGELIEGQGVVDSNMVDASSRYRIIFNLKP